MSLHFNPRRGLIVVPTRDPLFHQRRSFPALSYTLPSSASVDGVLGLDFLRDRRLIVDFRASAITLE